MAFTLQGFGPFLHWLTLVILCVLPVVLGIVLYKVGGLPGSIAAARGHPHLPAGTQGDAAVYSGRVQIAGVIRMAVMRMTSWTNYLYFTS